MTKLTLIAQLGAMVQASPDQREALRGLTEALGKELDASRCSIYVLRPEVAMRSATYEWCAPGVDPAGDALIPLASVFAERDARGDDLPDSRLMVVGDIENVPLMAEILALCRQTRVRSFVLAPLEMRGHVVGGLALQQCNRVRHWTYDEVLTVQAVSGYAAICLQIIHICEKERLMEQARLSAELERTQVRRELDRIRSEIIATVSHEMRTPVGLIKGYASALLMKDVRLTRDTRERYLNIIADEAERLGNVADDLLQMSLMRVGSFRLEKKRVDIRELMARSIERIRQSVDKRFTFILDAPGELPLVEVDVMRLERVMDNLLDNAVKYSPLGGHIVVRVEVADSGGPRPDVLVSVADEGSGIPSEDLPYIFEPFFRSPRTEQVEGAGLGLALCREIIAAHGGHIEAESQIGKGSRFSFTLPVGTEE